MANCYYCGIPIDDLEDCCENCYSELDRQERHCEFCECPLDNHSINCPENESSFARLIQKGYC